jgi:DNA processing protein
LIRQGAKLVETAADILEDLKLNVAPNLEAINSIFIREKGGSGDERSANPLLDALGFGPVSLDAIQARTGLPTADLQALLMTLELEGQVARLRGGLFQRFIKT